VNTRTFSYVAWATLLAAACSTTPPGTSQPIKTTLDIKTSVKFDVLSNTPDSAPDLGASGGTDAVTVGPDAIQFGDTAPVAGEFGSPCAIGGDCDSGFCVPTPTGSVCSKACNDVCPDGFKCAPYNPQGGDVNYVCVSAYGTLCDPCSANAACNGAGDQGNVCVSFGPDGSFCGALCGGGKTCPPGYDCQTVMDPVAGKQVKQCVILQGSCPCSPKAITDGLQTDCQNKNLYGTCNGTRKCTSSGLTDCQAQVPKPEECNGLDDDCNGKTDDFDVTASCKKTNKFGTCLGVLSACTGGQPVCDAPEAAPELCNGLDDDCNGVTDDNLCDDGQLCTKDSCNTDGSCKHLPQSGAACDDGNSCTSEDLCSQGVCTGGKPLGCNDNDPCTIDGCDALGGCIHMPQDGTCTDDGNACTQDVCIGGVCSHPATAAGGACLEDGDACTQDVCMGGACTHPAVVDGAPCLDDGSACTQDVCGAGKCTHPPVSFAVACADDGNACTADVCDKGACAHLAMGSEKSCLDDGDPCTQDVCLGGGCSHPPASDNAPCPNDGIFCTDDVCQGGKCTHPYADLKACLDDGEVCTQDVCDSGACEHPPKPGSPACLIDGNPCTDDKCQGGSCKPIYNNAGCDDNDPCTTTDFCNLGACKGIGYLDCNDSNSCTNDSCQKGMGCTHTAADGYLCDDGDKCTTGDQCSGGQCVGTGDKKCDDGKSCTIDSCDGGSGCTHVNSSAACTDDGNACTSDVCSGGACTHNAATAGSACGNSSNPCLAGACQGTTCQMQPTTNVCSDGNACTSNDKCAGGVCSGQAFKDCSDGDPCTQDSCDALGNCTHSPGSGQSCTAASSDCPVGTCNGGKCLSTPGVTCQATYSADLCSDVEVPGNCSGSGQCVATSAPPGYTCPGCNGICVKCFIFQFCIPLF